jgi:hypothetical protein
MECASVSFFARPFGSPGRLPDALSARCFPAGGCMGMSFGYGLPAYKNEMLLDRTSV